MLEAVPFQPGVVAPKNALEPCALPRGRGCEIRDPAAPPSRRFALFGILKSRRRLYPVCRLLLMRRPGRVPNIVDESASAIRGAVFP